MALVYSPHSSGLVVALQAADERSVQAALKRLDPDLMLTPDRDAEGRPFYRVLKRVSARGDAVPIKTWHQPLSHALVDEIDKLRVDGRVPAEDVEAHNERLRQRQRAEDEAEFRDYAEELIGRLRDRKASCLPRGTYRRNTSFKDVIR